MSWQRQGDSPGPKVAGGCDFDGPTQIGFSLDLIMERIPQPPVNPALRDVERHDFWLGFIAALIGIILTFCGARHLTAVDTVDGGNAWETQLIKAFAFDGLQYADKMSPPPPPRGDDPDALERWARQNRETEAPTWKIRVDTAAKTPCPT